jgi:hypothetical protein
MTRPDYCPAAQEPCQAMCILSDVRCQIRDGAPQPQQWVGLTDEEREEAIGWSVEHIEAKLKEKNHGLR